MRALILLLLFATLPGAGSRAWSAQPGWKEFRSPQQRFSVRYPPSWHELYAGSPMLSIINFPDSQRRKGVVISPTGAWIQAGGPPPEIDTIAAWIRAHVFEGDTITEQRDIRNPRAAADGCSTLREVAWFANADGGIGKTYYSFTSFYCSEHNRLHGVFLMNWKGDPKQAELRETALRIAESLRAW